MTSQRHAKNLSLETSVFASKHQVCCDVADEAVVLSMRDGQYYGLNEVAASIWRLVQAPRTLLEVRDALLEQFSDVESAQCEDAIFAFVTEMAELELIEFR